MTKVRTTLNLDPDALAVARSVARAEGRSLGSVVSELIRRGIAPAEARLDEEMEFPVFRVPAGAPRITHEAVRRALEED